MNYKELAQSVEQYAIDLRRHFHMYPEISLQEEKTSARICEELEAMGIPYDVVGNRNVVGRIECGEGKKIAIRADIDALPMQEEIEWEFKSKIDGVMHSCGHDAHTACLLATAKALLQVKDELSGTIYLCFQIAEETGGNGPQDIIAHLNTLGGVDQVISTHIFPSLPTGTISIKKQAMFAGNCKWKLVVTGQGGHGSRPDNAIDPIRPAAQILGQIVSIPSNRHNPFSTCVISPCMFNAGTAYNIIPNTATIEGNMRTFGSDDASQLIAKMEQMAQNTAAAYGATAEVIVDFAIPPIINHDKAVDRAVAAAKQCGLNVEMLSLPNMGSDDYSYFTEAYEGFYCFFGAHSDMPGTSDNNHNSRFFLDESAFAKIVEFFIAYTDKYLHE